MKVLITGGTGFVGSNLARYLAENGSEVTICDNNFRGRFDSYIEDLIDDHNIKFIKCDLTETKEFDKLEQDYDEIYHLAAINGTGNFYKIPEVVLRVNLLSVLNLLDWVVTNKIKSKLLFSSSSEAYAGTLEKSIPTPENISLCVDDVFNPRWSYGGSKIVGELLFINYAKRHDLDMRIIRYHNIYGPRMGFEHVIPQFSRRAANLENPFNMHAGSHTRAFCYIDDAVEATCLAMRSPESKGQIVNVGTNEETTISDIAKMIFKFAGYEPKTQENDPPEGSTPRRCPDIKKLCNLTNFQPKISLQEGVKRTYEWYKNYYENLPQ